jgi:hypothetical protein
MRTLESLVEEAVALGHLRACDPEQVAFEIEALLVAANHVRHLTDDRRALTRARVAIAHRLEELRTPATPLLTEDGAAATP